MPAQYVFELREDSKGGYWAKPVVLPMGEHKKPDQYWTEEQVHGVAELKLRRNLQ